MRPMDVRIRPVHPGLQSWQKARVEEMLRARIGSNISLAELAAACAISASHFARSFRSTFGTSARQYLIRLRVERAKALLAQTNKSLAQIADLCGFCDQAAFTRAFNRAEQITPLRWRQLNNSQRRHG